MGIPQRTQRQQLRGKGQGAPQGDPPKLWLQLERMVHLPVKIHRAAHPLPEWHRNVGKEPPWLMKREQKGGKVTRTGTCSLLKVCLSSCVGWHLSVISAFRRQRQKNQRFRASSGQVKKFECSLGCVRLCLKVKLIN